MIERTFPAGAESIDVFIPGNGSYPASDLMAESGFHLELTRGSHQRAEYVATHFDDEVNERVIFAGGYPGMAQGEAWPKTADGRPYVPLAHETEAVQMSMPLVQRLGSMGWNSASIDRRVHTEGRSDNSIGDILWSVRSGALEPDRYHDSGTHRDLMVVAGPEQAARVIPTLATVLDMDPRRILRASIRDPFGLPSTDFLPGQSAVMARAQARVALAIHRVATQDLRRGDLDGLADAEVQFAEIAHDLRRGRLSAIVRVALSLA